MKKPAQHPIAEVPRRRAKVEMTIGIDLGDVWSHYCTLNQDGEAVDSGRLRTTPKAIEKWFTDVAPARVAMEAGTHSIWISAQLQELGHEIIVANVRELRAISHSDRKSDQVDAEKLARYARLDPNILRPIAHRTVQQQEALTLVRARALLVRLRTAAVNAVRGLTKSCGYRMKVLLTGGTGVVGRQLAEDLQRRGVQVRVLTRKTPETSGQSSDVEFFVGNMLDPHSMRDALQGIDKLFLLNAVTAEELTQSLIVLGMAKRASLQHITYLSVLAAECFPDVPHFAAKLAVETALRQSGIPFTILRPGFYFQNDLGLKDTLVDGGLYPVPIGSKGISGADIRDIAEAAAISLTSGGCEGQIYDVVSAQPITGPGNAKLWGRLLNREVRYAGHDFDRFEEQMRAHTDAWEAYDMREMFEGFHERGFVAPDDEIGRLTTLLKRPPRTYAEFASQAAAQWLSGQVIETHLEL